MDLNSNQSLPLRTLAKRIDAGYYNRVRLGLMRLSNPLRIELAELHVEVVFKDDLWMCVSQDAKTPLLTWTDFDTQRTGLHQPVACTLHLYHIHAGLLAAIALESTHEILRQRLGARRHFHGAEVVSGSFRNAKARLKLP